MGCGKSQDTKQVTAPEPVRQPPKKQVVIPQVLTEKRWVDQELPEAPVQVQQEREKTKTVLNLGAESKVDDYLIIQEVKCENYQGYNLDGIDLLGFDEFLEHSQKSIKEQKNKITTYAVGASKCNVKNLKDVEFSVRQGSACVIYAKLIEEFADGICLFQLQNYVFTPINGSKNKGRIDVDDIDQAIKSYKQMNLERHPNIVGSYGDMAKRLVYKDLTSCKIEYYKDMFTFLFARKLSTVLDGYKQKQQQNNNQQEQVSELEEQ